MILPKTILITMLSNHWVTETITSPADPNVIQLILIKKDKSPREEPFPGLTDEILKFVQSDEVSHIHSVVTDQTRKAVNIILTAKEEPHVSVPE